MTKIDIEAIAREAGFITGARDYADGNGKFRYIQSVASGDFKPELKRFAALLLENVAQNHDEAAKEWARMAEGCNSGMYDDKAMAAQQLADGVRQMAAGMGE